MRGLTLVAFFMLSAAVPAFADLCSSAPNNIVANCGFENGVYTSTIDGNTDTSVPVDWTPNAAYDLEEPFPFNFVTSYSKSGNDGLSIGNYDDQPVPTLSQTLSDVAGATYSGSLFIAYGGAGDGDTSAFFDVLINGVSVLSLNDTATYWYSPYTFSFVGTGSDVLTLEGNTNPVEWYVDDIVVTDPSSVPEPGSILLLATVLGLCCVTLRKRGSPNVPCAAVIGPNTRPVPARPVPCSAPRG
jgi:hypothetical protein